MDVHGRPQMMNNFVVMLAKMQTLLAKVRGSSVRTSAVLDGIASAPWLQGDKGWQGPGTGGNIVQSHSMEIIRLLRQEDPPQRCC